MSPSRRRSKVSMAPLAITSAGEIVVNAYQLAMKDELHAAIEVAKLTRLPVFVGVVLPARLHPKILRDVDDAAADIVGRLGPKLLKRRGRRGLVRPHRCSGV